MQDFDVYRPPADANDPGMAPSRGGGGGPPTPWDPSSVLSEAWDIVRVHWPVLVFAPIVAWLCEFAVGMIMSLVKMEGSAGVGASVTSNVVQFVIGSFFAAGLCRLFVSAGRRGVPEFGAIFEGGKWFGKMFLVRLLLGIVELTILIAAFAPATVLFVRELGADIDPERLSDPKHLQRMLEHMMGPDMLLALLAGFAVTLIPTVFITLRLQFAPYYIADAGVGPIDGLGASWRATSGQVLKLFGYAVLKFFILVGATLACCLPFLLAWPVVTLGEALIFLHISGRLGEAAPAA